MEIARINNEIDDEIIRDEKEPSRVYLVLFVLISFFFHFFINTMPSWVFIVSEIALALLFLLTKPIYPKPRIFYFWIVSFLGIFIGFLHSGKDNQSLFNIITIFCGLLLMVGYSENTNTYRCVLKWIVGVSLFFAIGILLQLFWPNLYLNVMALFPKDYAWAVLSRIDVDELEMGGIHGFSTNSGFSAGYIVAGLFAYITLHYKEIRFKHLIVILFMVFSLLCTGKRAHVLFFVAAVLITYIMSSSGSKLLLRSIGLVVIIFVAIVIFSFTKDFLVQKIPFFAELITTQEGLNQGEDVTSGRTVLYEHALKLFKENPVFGIGWRGFRKTTSEILFKDKSLDTHNIYLQLLCETGVFGVILIIPAFFAFWIKTRRTIRRMDDEPNEHSVFWRPLLWLSYSYQTFFILYGLTGNVLYDCHYETMYFFSCSLLIAYLGTSRLIPTE